MILITYQVDPDDVLDLFRLFLCRPLDVWLFISRTAAVDDVVQIRGRFRQLKREKKKDQLNLPL